MTYKTIMVSKYLSYCVISFWFVAAPSISFSACLFNCSGVLINTGFGGEVANELFFQKSIDKVGEKFDELGAKYTAKLDVLLDGKIAQLDDLSKKRLDDLDKILTGQVHNLDVLADAKIEKLDNVLQSAQTAALQEMDAIFKEHEDRWEAIGNELLAQLFGGGDDFIRSSAQALRKISAYLVILLFTLATFVIYFARNVLFRKNSQGAAIGAIAVAGVLCTAIWLVSAYINKKEEEKEFSILENAFADASVKGNITLGIRIASRMAGNGIANSEYNVSKLKIFKQYFYNPRIFRNKESREAFIKDIGDKLLQGGARTKTLDIELSTLLAEMLATYGENRHAHYVAAVLASHALRFYDKGVKEKALYFGIDCRETAKYVLQAYLQFPMTDEEVTAIFGNNVGPSILEGLEIPTVPVSSLVEEDRISDISLTDRHRLYLSVRLLTIKAHLAYSAVLAAVTDPSSSKADHYQLPTDSQKLAYQQAHSVLREWAEFFERYAYINSNKFDRMVMLSIPFAILDELEAYKENATRVLQWYPAPKEFYKRDSRFPIMSRAQWVKEVYLEGRNSRDKFEKTLLRLMTDGVISSDYAKIKFPGLKKAQNEYLGRLLHLQTSMIFSMAYKDKGTQVRSTSEDPMEDIAVKVVQDSKVIKDLLTQVVSFAVVWCEADEPTCSTSSLRSFIDSIRGIAKEANFSIEDEVQAARVSASGTLISRIY